MSAAPRPPLPQPEFLPMTRADMARLGWDALDVLLVTGDAYVDHPSFGMALLGRWLVSQGYRTGIVAQPDWTGDADALAVMGRPRLLVGVTAGALDSMLAHYTAFRKLRHDDAYTPGGRHGARPNRATLVYAGMARRVFPGLPVIAGGIEASLRRASHYDFWEDKIRRPIVLDAKLDAVLYGMAETSLLALVQHLDARAPDASARIDLAAFALAGASVAVPAGMSRRDDGMPEASSPAPPPVDFTHGPGSVDVHGAVDWPAWAARAVARRWMPADARVMVLPSHEAIIATPPLLLAATLAAEKHVHTGAATRTWLAQAVGDRVVITAPPASDLEQAAFDALYALPFTRRAHPSHTAEIPALTMIRDSITSHRGCGGACTFCSLALHQGRRIRSRGASSIVAEAARVAESRGVVSDVGGPSANMWGAACRLPSDRVCERTSCLYPSPCRFLHVPVDAQIDLLRQIAAVPGVRTVRVASGVRIDLAVAYPAYLRTVAASFTGGQLKVAPEHIAAPVLRRMRKAVGDFDQFEALFRQASKDAGKEQYLVPYFMSAFPGTTDADMDQLAGWLARRGWSPQQVQCFIPTPGTVATAMYYGGGDESGAPIAVARTDADRLRQHGRLAPSGAARKGGTRPRRPDGRPRGKR